MASLGCLRMLAIDACECKDVISRQIIFEEDYRDQHK
jgi:hypothetical protein